MSKHDMRNGILNLKSNVKTRAYTQKANAAGRGLDAITDDFSGEHTPIIVQFLSPFPPFLTKDGKHPIIL